MSISVRIFFENHQTSRKKLIIDLIYLKCFTVHVTCIVKNWISSSALHWWRKTTFRSGWLIWICFLKLEKTTIFCLIHTWWIKSGNFFPHSSLFSRFPPLPDPSLGTTFDGTCMENSAEPVLSKIAKKTKRMNFFRQFMQKYKNLEFQLLFYEVIHWIFTALVIFFAGTPLFTSGPSVFTALPSGFFWWLSRLECGIFRSLFSALKLQASEKVAILKISSQPQSS